MEYVSASMASGQSVLGRRLAIPLPSVRSSERRSARRSERRSKPRSVRWSVPPPLGHGVVGGSLIGLGVRCAVQSRKVPD